MPTNIFGLILTCVIVVIVFSLLLFLIKRYKKCPSDKVMVIYGKVGSNKDGSTRSAKCIHGGAAFIWPVIQSYEFLDLTPMSISVDLENALSRQNIRINVPSRFTVGVSTEPGVMQNAAERLLGLKLQEIQELAKDIIFGQLRLVIATMDIEEINTDRDKFLEAVSRNVEGELKKIGLRLINVNVTDISDESGYIDALGKEAAAKAINDAKKNVAEKDRDGSIGEAQARRDQRIQVAQADASAIQGENSSKVEVAMSNAQRREKEAEATRIATAAEKIAAAQALEEAYAAEQKAEAARAQREKATQEADVIVKTEIDKRRRELEAEAEAEQIRRRAKGEADAILAMQLRTLTRMNRDKIVAEHEELQRKIADYIDILAKPERQRKIVGDELDEIVAKYGDERRTRILPYSGEMNVEDLIAEENVVVTVTHSGFIKRTKADEYRAQHRGGKGIKGAKLREDDVVDHFFLTSTHNWLLFFTNKGRVYRLKAYELPEGSRDSKGQHVANLLQFGPDEAIQTVLSIPNYEVAKYLVLATRSGKVKKTALAEYDSPRQGGLIAVRLMTDENGENADELIGAALCNAEDDIILVSKLGMSLKFQADDEQLRPMGRQTAGVQGMKFREGDELLAMDVVWGDSDKDLLVVTNEGFAKRTAISEYRLQGRNGYGVKAVQLAEGRGSLVGAVIVEEDDQVMAIMKSGKVIRSNVAEVKRTGRNTQGVTLAKPDKNDEIISIARNEEKENEDDEPAEGAPAEAVDGQAVTTQSGENVEASAKTE